MKEIVAQSKFLPFERQPELKIVGGEAAQSNEVTESEEETSDSNGLTDNIGKVPTIHIVDEQAAQEVSEVGQAAVESHIASYFHFVFG